MSGLCKEACATYSTESWQYNEEPPGFMGAHGKANAWQAILQSDWAFIDPFEAL